MQFTGRLVYYLPSGSFAKTVKMYVVTIFMTSKTLWQEALKKEKFMYFIN